MNVDYASLHSSPRGPGDERPTAAQIIHNEQLDGALSGKVFLITGCSSGIGLETARALYLTGATLFLTARDLGKLKSSLGNLASNEHIHTLELDLNSFESIKTFAAKFLTLSPTLNTLICNAGVMTPPEGRTMDGFETQLQSNHLGHFLLFHLLSETLLNSATPEYPSRVVILSSAAHRFGQFNFDNINFDGQYDPMAAYASSKTANLWTASEIERRYASKNLHAWSVHPGAVVTELNRHTSEEATKEFNKDAYLVSLWKNAAQGAATSTWAAVTKTLEGKGGSYLENCQISQPFDESGSIWGPGYAPWAYDRDQAKKLWELSLELVGIKL